MTRAAARPSAPSRILLVGADLVPQCDATALLLARRLAEREPVIAYLDNPATSGAATTDGTGNLSVRPLPSPADADSFLVDLAGDERLAQAPGVRLSARLALLCALAEAPSTVVVAAGGLRDAVDLVGDARDATDALLRAQHLAAAVASGPAADFLPQAAASLRAATRLTDLLVGERAPAERMDLVVHLADDQARAVRLAATIRDASVLGAPVALALADEPATLRRQTSVPVRSPRRLDAAALAPAARLTATVTADGPDFVLHLPVRGSSASEITVAADSRRIVLTVGRYRRGVQVDGVLARCTATVARIDAEGVDVRFVRNVGQWPGDE